MSHREYIEQRIYDRLEREANEEAAMDNKLLADNARLARRLKIV
jgi:hypothetical protein